MEGAFRRGSMMYTDCNHVMIMENDQKEEGSITTPTLLKVYTAPFSYGSFRDVDSMRS